jgi:exodeoxyribonuclease VII large subunit
VERAATDLAADRERLTRAPALLLERKRAGLEAVAGRLRTLSPMATLGRGYAIVRTDDRIVRSSAQLAPGERVDVELAEGGFGARVEETAP